MLCRLAEFPRVCSGKVPTTWKEEGGSFFQVVIWGVQVTNWGWAWRRESLERAVGVVALTLVVRPGRAWLHKKTSPFLGKHSLL